MDDVKTAVVKNEATVVWWRRIWTALLFLSALLQRQYAVVENGGPDE